VNWQRRVLFLVENLPSPLDRRVWREACAPRDGGCVVSIICSTGRGAAMSPTEPEVET
jgi:hypothetical protein